MIHRFDVHCKTVEKTTEVSCHKPSGDKIIYHGLLPKIHEYSGSELSVENSFISRGRNDEVVRPIERHDHTQRNAVGAHCAR
jgi:hypothetical protein